MMSTRISLKPGTKHRERATIGRRKESKRSWGPCRRGGSRQHLETDLSLHRVTKGAGVQHGHGVEGNADEVSWPDQVTFDTFDELERIAREVAGNHAHVVAGRYPEGSPYIEIMPFRVGARSVSIVADQWIVLAVESSGGGRWELDYDRSGLAFVRNALAAVAAGRLEERVAFGRSQVTLTFQDGTAQIESGYHGRLALLLPQPGWRRWGKIRAAVPYA
jgi:hypothetical protein